VSGVRYGSAMKNRGTWLAVATSLAALLACGSTNNGDNANNNTGSFPYTGPSCSPTTVNGSCWSCLESSCNGGCLTSACNDFFTCFCNCAQGNESCYQGCESSITSSCEQCVAGLDSCEQSSCSSECGSTGTGSGVGGSSGSSSGGSGFTGCSTGTGAVCANGGSIQFCETGFSNMCTSAYYQVGSQTFPCTSCTDTTSCAQQAQDACGPSEVDAGPPPFDVGVPDSPVFDGIGGDGATTCHAVACPGDGGQTIEYCETDDGPNGACTAAWFAVGPDVFECTSCSQQGCQAAEQAAGAACQ
jgi:hypothetical protein